MGRPEPLEPSSPPARGAAAAELGEAAAGGAAPRSSRGLQLPERRARCRRRSPRPSARTPSSTATSTASPRGRPGLSGPGPAALRAARGRARRGRLPGRRAEVARVLEICARGGHRRRAVRRAARSVVGGVEPLRGSCAADHPRPAPHAGVEVDRDLADGDVGAGPARTGGRGRAGREGPDAGPLPAVVRVRDDRRVRRDPLGRAGIERLRALRRARDAAAGRRRAARS